MVAGRYRRFNQLIGPEVFPFYWFTLRLVLTIVLVVQVLVGAVLIAAGGDLVGGIVELIVRLITSFIATVGWVTLGFVVAEHTGAAGSLMRWDPRRLPPAAAEARKSRFDIAVELAFTILFIAWWSGVVHWRTSPDDGVIVAAGPTREVLHLPVLAAAVAGAVVGLGELVRPGWTRLNAGLDLAWNGAALVLLAAYLAGGPLLLVSGAASPERLASLSQVLNTSLLLILVGVGLAIAWEGFKSARWLWRQRART